MIEPCMGGFCRIRTRCPHYAAPAGQGEPAERLCLPGHDGIRPGRPSPMQALALQPTAIPQAQPRQESAP